MCECESCKYHRHVEEVKKTGTVEELRALIDELYERYVMTDFDLDVWEAIGKGTWPSARQTALNILEKVNAYEENDRILETIKTVR